MRFFFILVFGLISNTVLVAQIEPKSFKVQVSTDRDLKLWDYRFNSAEQFEEELKQPNLELLSAGETAEIYYSLMRNNNMLLVVFWPRSGGRFQLTKGIVGSPDQTKTVILKSDYAQLIPLLSTDVSGPEINGITYKKNAVPLYGNAFYINPNFKGTMIIDYRMWNDKYINGVHLVKQIQWE